jgi:hypothetical protein
MELQRTLIAPTKPEGKRDTYELVRDVETRWNSFDDAARRALYLQPAIDELLMEIQLEHDAYVSRSAVLNRAPTRKAPAILHDRLDQDDWHVISLYHNMLHPLKHWTMQLQGQAGNNRFGAIWRVIPAYDALLLHFEELRKQYPVQQSLQVHNKSTRSKRLAADSQS